MTEADDTVETGRTYTALPVVAVVGRPNVGKSTLVNRILGRREAVVEDRPGVTRDRVAYDASWSGRDFIVVDTGGWEPDAQGLAARVAAQAELAVEAADVVLLVVDAEVGITDTDEAVVQVLRRAKKPVVLAANKVDSHRSELEAASLWSLGLGEPMPVSALHGRGSGDLLDALLAAMPPVEPAESAAGGPHRVALLGRPNVGKSSLLNRLAGESRVVVDSVAGTTVDPVDELIELGGEEWRFVDTAGIRRRVHEASGSEYFASLRTKAALAKAEVAVVLIDASEPISEQDTRIISMVVEAGRALVLAYNKWDLLDDERRYYLDKEIERELGARAVGTAGERVGVHRSPHGEAGAGDPRSARRLVDAHPDGAAQRVPRQADRRAPSPRPRRQAATRALRHAGRNPAADLRPVHLRVPRVRIPTLHRASAARGVRVRGDAAAHHDEGAREALQEVERETA